MEPRPFAGASKTNRSILAPLERQLAPWIVPKIPRWIETYHLTLATVLWCAGIIGFSAAAARDVRWLWAVSLMVFLQWVTDHLDGKLGKYRNTGLVKWGYYMDHLLDYAFLCSIVIGYALLLPPSATFSLLVLLAVFTGFMVHSFLELATTESLKISVAGAGPTEFRLAIIVINALVIRFGTARMEAALPWVAGGGLVALALMAYATHRKIWRSDMAAKQLQAS
jgi:phosphatidylglycerophosphate synthase